MGILEVTREQLRQWYEVDLLSEEEIAAKLGTYQVWVNRKRKKFGIPTITQAERSMRMFPPLTDFQVQVLTGSLLGDGCLAVTSQASARFQEGHTADQAGYTDWKADVFKPYTSSLWDGVKKDKVTGKTHPNRSFSTVSCPQFRPFYDLFYPAPECVKVFPGDLTERMTPLVLAVWFMDDGSLTNRGEPRIAFGLDDVTRGRALKALEALGLKAVVYGGGGDQSIQFPKQTAQFKELVSPYLKDIPCMAYKIPTETEGQAHRRGVREITPEKVATLYQGGFSVEQIGELCGAGATTVGRRLAAAGVPRTHKRGLKKEIVLDFQQRAEEKQASRRADEEDLRSGRKSQEDLRKENGLAVRGKINFKKARKLA